MICATIYHHFINLWVADGRVMRDIINSQIIDWNFGKFSLIFLFLPPWYASKRRNESLITAHGSSFFKEIFTWCKIINFKITPMILNIKFFIWYANIKKIQTWNAPEKENCSPHGTCHKLPVLMILSLSLSSICETRNVYKKTRN